MKLGVLFSGGKDSTLALLKAREKEEVVCLISLISQNKESYMFHTPNIHLAELQAKAIGLPLVSFPTSGVKEDELKDLQQAILLAKQRYQIEGIVTGALASCYQASRIQNICNQLKLFCFNPLWQRDQISVLRELLERKFRVVIVGVFAYPFGEEWLGRELTPQVVDELEALQEQYHINPAGEGGEIETMVMDSPLHQRPIVVKKSRTAYLNYAGIYHIEEAVLG
ncbi:diphthine--ammonia ligase [Candidatus Woesearchaeota archaeon]|nr:diphthine--ammonia ligase [Candidatus Woesearchaeota archaeon]